MSATLVSFCLKAYNQKDYIGEALDGTLAQTYRPLEIVICDDHSTDGTWERILGRLGIGNQGFEVADAGEIREFVRDGVTVVLHRNHRNLGNCKNWEMCGKLAHGELLIKADGDDISLPDRTARVAEAWIRDGKRAKVVSHGCEVIDWSGRLIGVRDDIDARHPHGATMAWSRDCFEGWPEVNTRTGHDDVVYSIRARLLGGELVLKDRLVRYRVGSGVTSIAGEYRGPLLRRCQIYFDTFPQDWRDLASEKGKNSPAAAEIERELKDQEFVNYAWSDILEGRHFSIRLMGVKRVWKHFGFRGHVLMMLLILPWHLGDVVINLVMRRKNGGARA